MDDTQLADLGIERSGSMFLHEGRVVYEVTKSGPRSILSILLKVLTPEHLVSART
jgi:hypothetical protein